MVKTCEIKPEYSKIVDCESLVSKNTFLGLVIVSIDIRQLSTEKFFIVGGYLASHIKVEVLVDGIEKCFLDPDDYHFWEKIYHKLPPSSNKS